MANFKFDTKDILSKVNIVNVVKNYIPLTKKGRNYFGLCPFHNDSNPSMVVSEEKQIFNCFVCHTGGNAISFVQKKENISYRAAILKVAEMAGYDVSSFKDAAVDKYFREKKCFYDLNYLYTSVIDLSSSADALKYCEDRGLNAEIRQKFNIGFAPIDGEKTIEYLKNIKDDDGTTQKYSLKLLQDYGISNYKNGKYRDLNEGRITFGICNNFGEIVGFSARKFIENEENKDAPKYVNTKETAIFHKSEVLYNYYNAKNHTKNEKFIYIVEGFMDVIAFYKAGINSCVALMGTALSDKHISLLKNEGVEVRLCLDNDKPGQTNTLSIVKKFNKNGVNFRVVRKNDLAKDSDELFTNHGKDIFLEKVNDLISQQDFILQYYKDNQDFSGDSGKKAFIKQVFAEIINLEDHLEIQTYCEKIAELTGYSRTNVQKEFFRNKKKLVQPAKQQSNHDETMDMSLETSDNAFSYNSNDYVITSNSLKRIYKLERLFMNVILKDQELSKLCVEDPTLTFINPVYNEIFFYIKEYFSEINEFNVMDFIDYINNTNENSNDMVFQITEITLEEEAKLKKEQLQKFSKELQYEKKLYLLDKRINNELNDEKKADLMEKKRELIKNKKEYLGR